MIIKQLFLSATSFSRQNYKNLIIEFLLVFLKCLAYGEHETTGSLAETIIDAGIYIVLYLHTQTDSIIWKYVFPA